MASVTFPPAVGGDGSTVTDDSNASTGLGNGGHRTRFVPALSQVVAVANNTVTKATEAAASASTAAGHVTTASNWATKTDNFVSGSDNSAKSWAVGGTGSGDPTDGSAKDWAIQVGATVDGSDYSSKEYASGTIVPTGSAKDWATKTSGTVDGVEYSAKKYAQDAAVLFDQFDDKYLGAKASDPALDNDGNPLQAGATYVNTTTELVRFYTGSTWVNGISAVSGVSTVNGASGDVLVASLAANTFTGNQTGGDNQIIQWMMKDVGSVYLDKGTVSSGTVTFAYTDGSHQRLQVGGAMTIAVNAWPPSGNNGILLIELVNGASATTTWPTVNWIKSDGTTTTNFSENGVTLQTSGTDWVILWTRDAGTTVYGKIVR